MKTEDFPAGGYRSIPGVFQLSARVAALPGFEIVRVRFRNAPGLVASFTNIASHLSGLSPYSAPRAAWEG